MLHFLSGLFSHLKRYILRKITMEDSLNRREPEADITTILFVCLQLPAPVPATSFCVTMGSVSRSGGSATALMIVATNLTSTRTHAVNITDVKQVITGPGVL